MQLSDYQTNPSPESSAILQRIAKSDKNCIDAYGSLVWAMTRKYTDSLAEAETATLEIFLDVWKYAGRCDSKKFDEAVFIFLIAHRRLIKRSREIADRTQSETKGLLDRSKQTKADGLEKSSNPSAFVNFP